MIKESPRTSRMQEEDDYSLIDIDQLEEPLKDKESLEAEGGTNYFFIELLVCSCLLWSLLFIQNTSYGIQLTSMVKQTLQEEIQNPTVQQIIKEVDTAFKQVL